MQEYFLHYVWKHKKLDIHNLKTVDGEAVIIKSVGQHNQNAGPDFFNAHIQIGEQLWAGNVEIHVKSSDWFLHNHEQDKAYDNVILHVVWEHDIEVFRHNNSAISTLELKNYIPNSILTNYKTLFDIQDQWINCENDFPDVDGFILDNWLERLYFERLERKTKDIEMLLKASKNDWETILFKMLAKNFGLKVNGEAFLSLTNATDFSIVRKTQSNRQLLEALLFGQAGLLDSSNKIQNVYYKNLVGDYDFLKQKFQLKNDQVLPIEFFRLRPSNFPTIRLSQLAGLYHENQNVFSKVISFKTLKEFYSLFKVSTSSFWNNHYTFRKTSKSSSKTISKAFIDLLLINTIIPLKYSYAKQNGASVEAEVLSLISEINSEKNSIVDTFNSLRLISKSALQSQGLIQLKTEYCDKNKCLQCAVGNSLLSK